MESLVDVFTAFIFALCILSLIAGVITGFFKFLISPFYVNKPTKTIARKINSGEFSVDSDGTFHTITTPLSKTTFKKCDYDGWKVNGEFDWLKKQEIPYLMFFVKKELKKQKAEAKLIKDRIIQEKRKASIELYEDKNEAD